VDLPVRDREELSKVAATLELPDETVGALMEDSPRAHVMAGAEFIHLTVQAIEDGDKGLVTRDVHLVARPNLVLSTHDGPIDALERYSEQLAKNTRLGRLDAGSFLAALVDSVVGTWFERIDDIEQEIDRLDERALKGPTDEGFLDEVLRLRKRIAFVRRTVAPHREAIAPLARPEFELDERLGRPWPGLVDRLERVIDAVENARELLVGSFDIYLGRAAQRTNDVMKALTIVSAVLLPSVVLAGIMGMNFKLPFFETTANFWLVIGAMVALAATILAVARLRRWI
jgi:magnesium transporter